MLPVVVFSKSHDLLFRAKTSAIVTDSFGGVLDALLGQIINPFSGGGEMFKTPSHIRLGI
jgi:hypothetical protein